MASDLLKVGYDDLSDLDTNLTKAVNTMGSDSDVMEALSDAVGDSHLGDKIVDFGKDWSIHRKEIKKDLQWLRDKVRKIADELEKVDNDLASGLKG